MVSELCRSPKIVVPGTPLAKKSVAGGTTKYNPSGEAMRKFKSVATELVGHQGALNQARYKGPVMMRLTACFSRPTSHLKRHGRGLRATAPKHHTYKPDCDNIAKFVGDALTGLAYKDDAQVRTLTVSKLWIEDKKERVEIELTYG